MRAPVVFASHRAPSKPNSGCTGALGTGLTAALALDATGMLPAL
jgi:hypothetical protein